MKSKQGIATSLSIIVVMSIGIQCKKTDSIKYYCLFKNVNIREIPGLKGKRIGSLRNGEEVIYLNEKSNFTTEITLRGKRYNSPWIKIKKSNGLIGWVYQGTLTKEKTIADKGKNKTYKTAARSQWKAIIAYMPAKPEVEASEDWGWFLNDIDNACRGKGIYVTSVHLGDEKDVLVAEVGNIRIDITEIIRKNRITTACYILIQEGKEPEIINYDMPANTL